MGIEYLVTRLKAMRSEFIPQSDIESCVSGKDLNSLVALLNKSIFRKEIEKLNSREKQNITVSTLERCISEGLLDIAHKVYDVIRRIDTKLAEVVFSRWELEQIKYAVRYFSSGETIYEKRFRLLPLFPKSHWVDHWRSYQSVSEFLQALKNIKHPFVSAIKSSESKFDAVNVETSLEQYYFQNYLPENKGYIGDTWEYYVDQCDAVNMHQTYLLRGKPEYFNSFEKHFIDGPGRFNLKKCLLLLRSTPAVFRRSVEKGLHCRLKPECEESAALFSLALRQSFLIKYFHKSIETPTTLWDIFLFWEELLAVVSNLKLALRLRSAHRPLQEVADYFVCRRIA
tara:strand:- start:2495 stop:3517 length:1023 start_codon:yes stop_codon:yes gene_type:complete